MTFGEKLYALRKKHGLSQEQLAEALNVSRQSISKWEGNVTYPESEKLIALSDYFRVSLDYLMKADWTDENGLTGEEAKKDEPARKQTALLSGVTICIASVIGLIWFGLVSLLLPDTHEQIGASSIINLNGTALLVLFLFGLLTVGVALIIRFINKK